MSRSKKNHVRLRGEQHDALKRLTGRGEAKARVLSRARILLAHDGRENLHIASAVHVGRATVENIRRRFVQQGFDAALHEKPRPGGEPRLDREQEAVLIALACGDSPAHRTAWTMHLLADRLVELQVVDAISDEAVRRRLKKRAQTLAAHVVVHCQDHARPASEARSATP